MEIRTVTDANKDQAFALLDTYRESSLFLLGNFKTYGPVLTDHLNSGNFKYLVDGETVLAVWCLTRRGNVLVQSDRQADYSVIICDDLETEPLIPSGAIGPFGVADQLWKTLTTRNTHLVAKFNSKEILYNLTLSDDTLPGKNHEQYEARFLCNSDFEQWNIIDRAYVREMELVDQIDDHHQKQMFLEQVSKNYIWGLFDGSKLISTTCFNTRYETIGQVGGVYTLPDHRGRGLSKICVQQQITDARIYHHLDQLILFTGDDNAPARRVYESLGFQQIGFFGLLLGEVQDF
jgi:predicted GNAT family acetyltransferase